MSISTYVFLLRLSVFGSSHRYTAQKGSKLYVMREVPDNCRIKIVSFVKKKLAGSSAF